jgi:hypothetical protein
MISTFEESMLWFLMISFIIFIKLTILREYYIQNKFSHKIYVVVRQGAHLNLVLLKLEGEVSGASQRLEEYELPLNPKGNRGCERRYIF